VRAVDSPAPREEVGDSHCCGWRRPTRAKAAVSRPALIKVNRSCPNAVIRIFRKLPNGRCGSFHVDKKQAGRELTLRNNDTGAARGCDLVSVRYLRARGYGCLRQGEGGLGIISTGNRKKPQMIAIHAHEIPQGFAVRAPQAEEAKPPSWKGAKNGASYRSSTSIRRRQGSRRRGPRRTGIPMNTRRYIIQSRSPTSRLCAAGLGARIARP